MIISLFLDLRIDIVVAFIDVGKKVVNCYHINRPLCQVCTPHLKHITWRAWLDIDQASTTRQRFFTLQSGNPTTLDLDIMAPYTSPVYKTARPSEEKQVKCNFIPGKQPKPGFS